MNLSNVKQICDTAIPRLGSNGRLQGAFRMGSVRNGIKDLHNFDDLFPQTVRLSSQLSDRTFDQALSGLFRAAFFIEPVVLPDCATTRFNTRWNLSDPNDPRSATISECVDIVEHLSMRLSEWIAEEGPDQLEQMIRFGLVAYEMPFEYLSRDTPIHRASNIDLIDSNLIGKIVGLRSSLMQGDSDLAQLFQSVYKKKVAIKSYLTDRVLTGQHKTNREKRWETHPNSVHFASRKTCMEIEHSLVSAVCHFEGFPDDVFDRLSEDGVLEISDRPARCPVTLRPLLFEDFSEEVLNPDHGRSSFQVGHMDPLKLDGNAWSDGHRASNIAWISADGNRIQGSLSVEKTRSMLKEIWQEYNLRGIL